MNTIPGSSDETSSHGASSDPAETEAPIHGDALGSELAEFHDLMERVRHGSDDAGRELLVRYGPLILRVVRRKLSKELRPKFDSMDFAQAVWASFYGDKSRLLELDRPEALIGRLVDMAKNKVIDEFRRRVTADCHEHDDAAPIADDAPPAPEQPDERTHTPSQEAMANDLWRRLVAGQPDDLQEIVRLRMVGLTCEEIADRLGMASRTVRRRLDELFEERNR
jgi:RNA polymerase sigma factor (sigma-70 family)